jgi:hypothetical protein
MHEQCMHNIKTKSYYTWKRQSNLKIERKVDKGPLTGYVHWQVQQLFDELFQSKCQCV